MNLTRVTISGADNIVRPEDMAAISKEFPFVEWGILLSRDLEGKVPRFPARRWLQGLLIQRLMSKMKIAAHVCGDWARELLTGVFTCQMDLAHGNQGDLWPMFERIQFNFPGKVPTEPNFEFIVQNLQKCDYPVESKTHRQFIFQYGNLHDDVYHHMRAYRGDFDIVPLFDKSRGSGSSPGVWPAPRGTSCGYAGGLGPDNLDEELNRIEEVVGDYKLPVWVDMETKVRTGDSLDLAKVRTCLEICQKRMGK